MSAANRPPRGCRRLSDWRGRRVRTVVDLVNGFVRIPAGTEMCVTGWHLGLELRSDPCRCCGIAGYVRRVPTADVMDLGVPAPEQSRARRPEDDEAHEAPDQDAP